MKIKTSITIEKEILDDIKELAYYDDRSISKYINILLKEHIKKRQDVLNKIRKQ